MANIKKAKPQGKPVDVLLEALREIGRLDGRRCSRCGGICWGPDACDGALARMALRQYARLKRQARSTRKA